MLCLSLLLLLLKPSVVVVAVDPAALEVAEEDVVEDLSQLVDVLEEVQLEQVQGNQSMGVQGNKL